MENTLIVKSIRWSLITVTIIGLVIDGFIWLFDMSETGIYIGFLLGLLINSAISSGFMIYYSRKRKNFFQKTKNKAEHDKWYDRFIWYIMIEITLIIVSILTTNYQVNYFVVWMIILTWFISFFLFARCFSKKG